jgi:hypothetical protein
MTFITYTNLVDCVVASVLIARADLERKAQVWDTVQGAVVSPLSVPFEDRYAYRLLPLATRNGQPVANYETDGPTLAWAMPTHDASGSWFVEWPTWGDGALQALLPAGFSLVASVTRDGIPAVLTNGQLSQIKVALYGSASAPCAIFVDGWCALTPFARHGTLARARGGPEVGV